MHAHKPLLLRSAVPPIWQRNHAFAIIHLGYFYSAP